MRDFKEHLTKVDVDFPEETLCTLFVHLGAEALNEVVESDRFPAHGEQKGKIAKPPPGELRNRERDTRHHSDEEPQESVGYVVKHART